jgi:hypothetical protein
LAFGVAESLPRVTGVVRPPPRAKVEKKIKNKKIRFFPMGWLNHLHGPKKKKKRKEKGFPPLGAQPPLCGPKGWLNYPYIYFLFFIFFKKP